MSPTPVLICPICRDDRPMRCSQLVEHINNKHVANPATPYFCTACGQNFVDTLIAGMHNCCERVELEKMHMTANHEDVGNLERRIDGAVRDMVSEGVLTHPEGIDAGRQCPDSLFRVLSCPICKDTELYAIAGLMEHVGEKHVKAPIHIAVCALSGRRFFSHFETSRYLLKRLIQGKSRDITWTELKKDHLDGWFYICAAVDLAFMKIATTDSQADQGNRLGQIRPAKTEPPAPVRKVVPPRPPSAKQNPHYIIRESPALHIAAVHTIQQPVLQQCLLLSPKKKNIVVVNEDDDYIEILFEDQQASTSSSAAVAATTSHAVLAPSPGAPKSPTGAATPISVTLAPSYGAPVTPALTTSVPVVSSPSSSAPIVNELEPESHSASSGTTPETPRTVRLTSGTPSTEPITSSGGSGTTSTTSEPSSNLHRTPVSSQLQASPATSNQKVTPASNSSSSVLTYEDSRVSPIRFRRRHVTSHTPMRYSRRRVLRSRTCSRSRSSSPVKTSSRKGNASSRKESRRRSRANSRSRSHSRSCGGRSLPRSHRRSRSSSTSRSRTRSLSPREERRERKRRNEESHQHHDSKRSKSSRPLGISQRDQLLMDQFMEREAEVEMNKESRPRKVDKYPQEPPIAIRKYIETAMASGADTLNTPTRQIDDAAMEDDVERTRNVLRNKLQLHGAAAPTTPTKVLRNKLQLHGAAAPTTPTKGVSQEQMAPTVGERADEAIQSKSGTPKKISLTLNVPNKISPKNVLRESRSSAESPPDETEQASRQSSSSPMDVSSGESEQSDEKETATSTATASCSQSVDLASIPRPPSIHAPPPRPAPVAPPPPPTVAPSLPCTPSHASAPFHNGTMRPHMPPRFGPPPTPNLPSFPPGIPYAAGFLNAYPVHNDVSYQVWPHWRSPYGFTPVLPPPPRQPPPPPGNQPFHGNTQWNHRPNR